MWELCTQRVRESKCENILWIWEWFNENVFWTQKQKLKVDHKIKKMRIM
jgi:hypothetical protein